jgi:outer membrane protein assembly factor BamB
MCTGLAFRIKLLLLTFATSSAMQLSGASCLPGVHIRRTGPDGLPFCLEATVPEGQVFALQSSSDLARWQRVAGVIITNSEGPVLEVNSATNLQSFYRLVREATMFRFDPQHSGICRTYGPTNTPTLKWKFTTGDHVYASPAVVGGLVYVGSVDTNFYALDAETGHEQWRFRAGGLIRSSAAVVDGSAYFASHDGFLYSLHASDGREIWRCRIAEKNPSANFGDISLTYNNRFDSSPTFADGVIYIGSPDKLIWSVNSTTGAPNWSYATPSGIVSSPAVLNGMVYVGGLDGYLYALDAVTGTNVWKFKTQGNGQFPKGEIYTAPTVQDQVVYFGSRDSALYAVEALTGTLKWRYSALGGITWVFNTPTVWSSLVVAGTSVPGAFFAVDKLTGTRRWQVDLAYQPYSSPAITAGVAYFGSGDVTATPTDAVTAKSDLAICTL